MRECLDVIDYKMFGDDILRLDSSPKVKVIINLQEVNSGSNWLVF